jgi:antitoxin HigA-1
LGPPVLFGGGRLIFLSILSRLTCHLSHYQFIGFIEDKTMTSQKLPPVHPGEILLEEYLRPLGISQNKLGRDLNVPAQRINEIVRGQRAITVDTALRLGRYFHTTPQFWLNLQSRYDLEMAQETRLVERVIKEVREREAV